MTAEVAVMNKGALALAADSAVTIGNGTQAKIYNTVNKIFELSESQALGIMIYGGLNFMGLPLEVIIKEYRRTLRGRPSFPTVRAAADAFRDHLETVPFSRDDAVLNLILILARRFEDLSRKTQESILLNAPRGRVLRSKFNATLALVVQSEIDRVSSLPACASLQRRSDRGILAGFDDVIDRLIDENLAQFRPSATTRASLHRLARLILHRNELSSHRSGVVVAGYGTDEICPSLISHEMDGIVGGRLKFVETRDVDITRGQTEVEAIGFAQDDMIDQFMNGVSRDFETFSRTLWLQTLEQLAESVVVASIPQPAVQAAVRQQITQAVIPNLAERVDQQIADRKERIARQSVVSMIQHMPKQELANLAAALVDLTSLKRRVSAARETVGGEVDVAVISKSEGFVWVKRKHYFPPELNLRFTSRHYASDQRGGAQ